MVKTKLCRKACTKIFMRVHHFHHTIIIDPSLCVCACVRACVRVCVCVCVIKQARRPQTSDWDRAAQVATAALMLVLDLSATPSLSRAVSVY